LTIEPYYSTSLKDLTSSYRAIRKLPLHCALLNVVKPRASTFRERVFGGKPVSTITVLVWREGLVLFVAGGVLRGEGY
jgi:hypothetical protein